MKQIGEFVKSAFADPDLVRVILARRALRQWPEVVGEVIAQNAEVERFDKGTVWVVVSGSAWAHELRMQSPVILDRLNQIAGEQVFFRLRPSLTARAPRG